MHHEDLALVTDESATNTAPRGCRYDNQIMILGKDFQTRCADLGC